MEQRQLKLVESYKLSNSEFGESFLSRLSNLHKFDKFTDVTLATDDGGRLPAHRLILATSFRLLIPHLCHQVPLLILSSLKKDSLKIFPRVSWRSTCKVCQPVLLFTFSSLPTRAGGWGQSYQRFCLCLVGWEHFLSLA